MLLVRPFVLKLLGVTALAPQAMTATAQFSWSKADKRREFLRVRQLVGGGALLS
jgi:molybdopterin molybdotransferase